MSNPQARHENPSFIHPTALIKSAELAHEAALTIMAGRYNAVVGVARDRGLEDVARFAINQADQYASPGPIEPQTVHLNDINNEEFELALAELGHDRFTAEKLWRTLRVSNAMGLNDIYFASRNAQGEFTEGGKFPHIVAHKGIIVLEPDAILDVNSVRSFVRGMDQRYRAASEVANGDRIHSIVKVSQFLGNDSSFSDYVILKDLVEYFTVPEKN